MTKNKKKEKFPGFPPDWDRAFWKYPRMLEGYWYMLNGSEQKILTFILRQCIGFRKDSDRITSDQFQNGIGKNNKGTGLSKGCVLSGIRGLVGKGFIWKKKISYRKVEYGLMVQKLTKDGLKNERDGSNLEQMVSSKINPPIEDSNRELTIEKEIEEIFSFYKEKICPEEELDNVARKVIAERLKKFGVCKLEKAIVNFSGKKWRMDNNRSLGFKWFFQSDGQIRKWLGLTPENEGKEKRRRGSLNLD